MRPNACMVRGEVHKGFCWGNLRERDHMPDPGLNWRIILKRVLRNWDVEHGLNLSGSGYGTRGGHL